MFFATVIATITGQNVAKQNSFQSITSQTSNITGQQVVNASLNCNPSHMTLSISGNVPAPTNGDNVWTTITDEKANQTIVVGLVGQGGIGGPGTGVSVNANFIDYAGSIRGQGSLQIFCDGRTYTTKIYYAPFTNSVPTLSNLVARAAASQTTAISSPSPKPTTLPSSSPSPSSGSVNGWSYSSTGGVITIPYPFIARQMFYIDFLASNFNNITNIYFNLNYDTDLPGTQRGVETTFVPTPDQVLGYDPTHNNWPYIRRQLFLGTCSKGVCSYDPNPRNFKITVTTTYKDGTKYTTVFTQ